LKGFPWQKLQQNLLKLISCFCLAGASERKTIELNSRPLFETTSRRDGVVAMTARTDGERLFWAEMEGGEKAYRDDEAKKRKGFY
jgi:hypothetical protein